VKGKVYISDDLRSVTINEPREVDGFIIFRCDDNIGYEVDIRIYLLSVDGNVIVMHLYGAAF
jgi:hypothetical protein